MKYCSHCGKQIMEQAVLCPHCGCSQGGRGYIEDRTSIGLNVLSFINPIIGLILYLIYEGKAPKRAKGIGKWALWGLATPFILFFGLLFLSIILGAMGY